jgi:hypothetical protein
LLVLVLSAIFIYVCIEKTKRIPYFTKFIKDNKLNVQGATADAATMAKLQNYLGNYFKDRANPKEYKLLKRYGSLVYKAVADYLNRNAAQAKQNTQ